MKTRSDAVRIVTLLLAAGASIAPALARAQSALHLLAGDAPGDYFGESIAFVGDLDGDGRDDLIVGAPQWDGGLGAPSGPGYARIYSGASGDVLLSLQGEVQGEGFGFVVDGAGDVDGDGAPDVVVGVPASSILALRGGGARVFSGADGSLIHAVYGEQFQAGLGAVAGLGDLDGDGLSEWAAGAAFADAAAGDDAGLVRVYSGADASVLHQFEGSAAGDWFGGEIAGPGDVNGDGRPDLVVGSALGGYARVYSGADGSPLWEFVGDQAGDRFGVTVDGTGDADADGFADIVVGTSSGRYARVFSGRTGAILHDIQLGGFARGRRVVGAGDMDGDGLPDVLVGGVNTLNVFSGGSGELLATLRSPGSEYGYNLGHTAVAAGGDADADGRPDVAASTDISFSGRRVVVLSASPPCADADGDGHGVPGSLRCARFAIDCDDGNPAISPSAPEVCNRIDDDCDLYADEDLDADGDTVAACDDCSDADPTVGGAIARERLVLSGSAGLFAPYLELIGARVAGVGDANGDGTPDFASSLDFGTYDGPSEVLFGVVVYSGSDGAELRRIGVTENNDEFGEAIAGAGDVDGDGYDDMIVGAPQRSTGAPPHIQGPGYAQVRSGRDGALLAALVGDAEDDFFGLAVAGVGDLTGDGRSEVAVGATQPARIDNHPARPGYVRVFDAGGGILRTWAGDADGDAFGSQVISLGDIDGDDVADIAVGAPGGSYVRLFSGADGAVIRTIQGAPGVGLGEGVGAAGDVDGDGVPDVILHRAPDDPPPPFIPGPTVLSGFDGSFIRSYASGTAAHLGSRVAGIGDLDRDGRADLMVGDRRPDVYSGATGAKLLRVAQEASQATPVGDTDLDGYPDLILGKGDSALGGTVRVVSLIPCSPECEDADWDGYGAPPGPACAFAEPDCDNADREVFPGATEICDNLIDDDCDGAADADDSDCSACGWVWYEDLDGDTWGNPERSTVGCGPYDHHVGRSEDCDDTRNWVNPVAREIPGNDVDENCNGSLTCGSLPPGASPWPAVLAFAPFAWLALRRRIRK